MIVNIMVLSTPEDVMPGASRYLTIYFAGISGLLIYNIGSGILRAVGDSARPLLFLALTRVLNIILDPLFVIVFHGGIAGVAYAAVHAEHLHGGGNLRGTEYEGRK